MTDTQKSAIQNAEALSEKNKSIVDIGNNIDNKFPVPWYIKLPTLSDSLYGAGIKLFVLVFGGIFLWQILREDDGIVGLIVKLFEMTIEHGKVGYLAFATAFYLLSKSVLLLVNQNRSNKL